MAARARLPRLPRLTLFTGPFCSLCDVAKSDLARLRPRAPFHLALLDIHAPGNARWRRAYQYDIPVLQLEGRVVMKHRIDGEALLRRLEEWRAAAAAEAEAAEGGEEAHAEGMFGRLGGQAGAVLGEEGGELAEGELEAHGGEGESKSRR